MRGFGGPRHARVTPCAPAASIPVPRASVRAHRGAGGVAGGTARALRPHGPAHLADSHILLVAQGDDLVKGKEQVKGRQRHLQARGAASRGGRRQPRATGYCRQPPQPTPSMPATPFPAASDSAAAPARRLKRVCIATSACSWAEFKPKQKQHPAGLHLCFLQCLHILWTLTDLKAQARAAPSRASPPLPPAPPHILAPPCRTAAASPGPPGCCCSCW